MSLTMPPFSVETTRVGDADILRLTGEMDIATIDEFRTAVDRLTDRGVTALVIDARDLLFIDSRGLHALIECMHTVRAHGSVALVPSRPLRRILQITALTEVLQTVNDFGAAVTAVSASAHQTGLLS